MTTIRFDAHDNQLTHIFVRQEGDETLVGFLDATKQIFQLQGASAVAVGHISAQNAVIRQMAHDTRELGQFTVNGRVTSHGLFEGGPLGWVEADGTVVRAGLLFGEEEVGRVAGPNPIAAGAALLLLFIPEADENRRNQARRF